MRRADLPVLALTAGALLLLVSLDVVLGGPLSALDTEAAAWARATLPREIRYGLMEDALSFPGNDAVTWSLVLASTVACLALRRWWAAGGVAIAGWSGMMLVFSLKDAFGRARPSGPGGSGAFPSGHATAIALTCGLLALVVLPALAERWPRLRPWRAGVTWALVALALVVGTARVLGGVHWPTDVLAGWALGAGWAALAAWAVPRAERLVTRTRRVAVSGPEDAPLPQEPRVR